MPTLVAEGSGVATVALASGLATRGEAAVAVAAGLVVAGVRRLSGLVAEGTLVALVALAAVGEGVEGQAQPVHAPVGTRCCQAPAGTARHKHAQPTSTGMAPAQAQYHTETGMALVLHSHCGTALPQHWHGSGMAPLSQYSTGMTQCLWHGIAMAGHHHGMA